MKDSDFKRIDLEKLSTPPDKDGFYRLIKNNYWLIDKDGKGLIYREHSVQCNSNKNINERLLKSENHPSVDIKFYENIFLPFDPFDFCQ